MQDSEAYLSTPDGIRLFYQVIGSGPTRVVFPNGLYLCDDFRRLAEDRTLIFYDVRNRGRSDALGSPESRTGGILNDVDDLDVVRRHFGADKIDLIGHSYIGLMVILYALRHGAHANRIVQLSPIEPHPGKQYPPHLKWSDDVMGETFVKLAQLQKERGSEDAQKLCEKFWAILRAIYVFDQAHAAKINWGRCALANERGFMKYWAEELFPSIQGLRLAPEQLATVRCPVLTIHGVKDRSAAYGGARDWARELPNARLMSLENVAHAPWVEAADPVFDAIGTFLQGAWPVSAEAVLRES
jgi:proline iminopeptidase